MAATSAYGKASRPRPGSDIDCSSGGKSAGTGEVSGRRVSITFMEPDKVPRVRASLATGGRECERRLIAATSAYGNASLPRSGSDIDCLSGRDIAGTVEVSGRQMSIAFMEPDLVPRVEASSVSGGRECAAGSVVFRPRGNEAGGPADRAFGIALAQGD